MFFQHVYDKSLAQASYIIGCQVLKEAIVIDPQRDMDVYLKIAEQNNLHITHVTETHIHADFLSGSRELAEVTGAELFLSDEGGEDWQYEFPHKGLKHGNIIKVGNLSLEIIHTPGHTPESISFLLTDHPASNKPVMLFTGDFVFVGDVGRPDLLEKAAGIIGTKEIGAKQMFESLKKFEDLPDYLQIWPGHGAGSSCGKSLGAVPSSTVGYEKIRNWALQFENNEDGFVENLLDGQPEPPKYFAMMKKLNKVDRPLLTKVPKHKKLGKEEFLNAYAKGYKIIDARHKTKFAEGHLPESINIQGNNSFSTWAGWILNYDESFMIICDENQIEDLTRKLMRVGLDNILGYISEIDDLGIQLEKVEQITIENMKANLEDENIQILDVRNQNEFKSGHICGAENLFIGTLLDNLEMVNKDKTQIVHCQSGDRSSIAYSLLKRSGFKNVKNFPGGMSEWMEIEKGYSLV